MEGAQDNAWRLLNDLPDEIVARIIFFSDLPDRLRLECCSKHHFELSRKQITEVDLLLCTREEVLNIHKLLKNLKRDNHLTLKILRLHVRDCALSACLDTRGMRISSYFLVPKIVTTMANTRPLTSVPCLHSSCCRECPFILQGSFLCPTFLSDDLGIVPVSQSYK